MEGAPYLNVGKKTSAGQKVPAVQEAAGSGRKEECVEGCGGSLGGGGDVVVVEREGGVGGRRERAGVDVALFCRVIFSKYCVWLAPSHSSHPHSSDACCSW